MAYVLLILATLIGLAGCAYFLRKNILVIREKNKNEPKAYKLLSEAEVVRLDCLVMLIVGENAPEEIKLLTAEE